MEACIARHTHLGTLAAISDQVNQASVVERRVRQEDGPLDSREVSSAYCSKLEGVEVASNL